MMQFTCAAAMCLAHYLGLGTFSYQSQDRLVLTTPNQTYYCSVYNTMYTCLSVMGGKKMDY